MKVAICFYGQPRKYKQVLEQWKRIISELNADVFIHTWYGQDRGRADINVNELIEDFSPKEIEISNPHKFIELIPEDSKYENQSYHGMNQAYTISRCLGLINEYSKNLQKEYDIIIKSRMDITIENVDEFIRFIKSGVEDNKLYVAANHWQGSNMFDDNLMAGKSSLIKDISINYFNYTIQFIKETKVIPGGEQNIFRWIVGIGMIDNIQKVNGLNFSLIPLPFNEIILNQNEK
jgi:hypothetical protein